MKKINKIITALIIILSTGNAFAAGDTYTPYDMDTMYDVYYEAPVIMPLPETEDERKIINMSSETKVNPMFKQMRIKITNFFRAKENAEKEKMMRELQEEFMDDEEAIIDNDPNIKEISDTKSTKQSETENNIDENEGTDENIEASEQTIELTGQVQEQKAENDVILDCDNIVYDEVKDELEAIGSPVLVFPPQKVSLKADKMTYNKSSNILKAYGNVELIKENSKIYGDYIQINMNEENAFMDNVKFKQANFVVNTRKATAENDKIILDEGNMTSDESYRLDLRTRMIGGQDFSRMLIDDDERSYLSDTIGDVPFKIKAEEVKVEGKKDHDTITLKKGTVYYGDKKLFRFKRFTAHTDKDQSYFEASYPELGSRSRLGMFAGPGFMFDLPNGSVVKAIPFLNYKNDLGVGGALKYRSANNVTDFAYGSAEDIFVLKGRQRLDDKLYLQYGINSYMDDGFMGRNMAKYAAEIYYKDETLVKDTLAKNLDLRFRQKAGIGYMHNTDYNKYFGNIPNKDIGTTRFKYIADIEQSLYKYENREKLQLFDLGLVLQGSAAVYGTGDTQFVGRIGPRIHSQYKRWMQDIGYFQAAYDDNTPLARFDTYRYGRSSVYIREALRINKYLAVGWSGNINLSNDSPNGEMFQENAFIVSLGPDDFKVNLGYDFIRQQTYFSFAIAMDMKGSSLDYKKMEIKNPDRIANSDTKNEKLIPTFEEAQEAKMKKQVKPVLKYAEVIDIQDPDREQL